MKRSTRALVAGAAFAGLMTGAVARTYASQQPTTATKGTSLTSWGQLDDSGTRASTTAKARTPVRARAVARPGTMAAKARTPAKARAVATSTSRASQPTRV